MPARGGSAVIVNHRVALSGTRARAAVVSHRVEYVATRPGCDRSATEADLARAREREAFVGYLGCRPGSTALFDADGAVSLAEARRRLDACGGAVVCSVISVRREDCERFGLDTKEGWQAYARANLTREYARMMGIPESRVGWVAAHHLNSEANQHIHVLAYDREGHFDRLLAKADMEHARRGLAAAAMRPEVERLGVEREAARDRAVEAVRSMVPQRLAEDVALPTDGRISYRHLRRYHPEAARRVEAAVERAAGEHPELREALDAHSKACYELADLKGLDGAEREAYMAKADADMRSRACNAALRAVAPDRTNAPGPHRTPRPATGDGPARTRARVRAIERELGSCMTAHQKAGAVAAARESRPVPTGTVSGCPTMRALDGRAPALLETTLSYASRLFADAAGNGRRSDPDAEAKTLLHVMSRLAMSALVRVPDAPGEVGRVAVAVSRPIARTVSIPM